METFSSSQEASTKSWKLSLVKKITEILSIQLTFQIPLEWMMDDMRVYVLFNRISVIPGQWEVDSERLCAMELC